jgi:hypothetical protein
VDDCQSTYLTKLKRKKKPWYERRQNSPKFAKKEKHSNKDNIHTHTHTHTHTSTAEERKEEVRGFGVHSNHGQHCHRRPPSSNQACKISYCFSFWCDIIIPPTLIFFFLIPSESASGPNSQSSSSSSSSWDRILLQVCYFVIE